MTDLSILTAIAKAQTTSLKVVEPTSRVGLTIGVTGRHPCLDVKLLDLRLTKVSTTDVDQPIGQRESLKELL